MTTNLTKDSVDERMSDFVDVLDMEAAAIFSQNKVKHEMKSQEAPETVSNESEAVESPSMDIIQKDSASTASVDSSESEPPKSIILNLQTTRFPCSPHLLRAAALVFVVILCCAILLPTLLSRQAPSAAHDFEAPPPHTAPSSHVRPGPSQSSEAVFPTLQPSPFTGIPYVPGKLIKRENQLLLSQGLSSKIIAKAGKFVDFSVPGTRSTIRSHSKYDFGATFPTSDGGWIYVSNAEVDDGEGGVGAFHFDADGNLFDYNMVLTNTSHNCGGGVTPWNAWISCEETNRGRCYQVDPLGRHEPAVITVGEETNGGKFESFAQWTRDKAEPHFFTTEDDDNGTVRRFIPDDPDWTDPWSILLGPGTTEYLTLKPSDMTYSWTSNVDKARINAGELYPGSEGIDQVDDRLYVITKTLKKMYTLDLLDGTYSEQSTKIGRFDGQPDQILVGMKRAAPESDVIYFSQDSDNTCGISAQNAHGMYTIVNTLLTTEDETSGLAFSPDGTRMYFAMQKKGLLYEVVRDDGLGFHMEPSTIQYESKGDSDRE